MGSAFTSQYKDISNKLINKVEVFYNGKSVKCLALWDTGATNCCVSQDVVKQLSLISTGKVNITTPNQTSERDTYLVDVNLPNDVRINDVCVIDSDIEKQNIGMLIGMNIINLGDFTVSNFQNKTTFTFRMPSESTTDYVKQIRISNIIGTPHGKGKRKKKR